MFRYCKTGGYNLEGSGLRGDRLIKMILLMAIAYTSAIFEGIEIQKKQVLKICISPLRTEKNTVDGVHLALASMENSRLIISIGIH